MRVYLAPKVLVIDEGDYLPRDDLGATIFFQLVSARYERGSIILTSNKSYGEWGSTFGDSIIATAILDRLLHHSTTINIRGESYRLKARRKAGLIPYPNRTHHGVLIDDRPPRRVDKHSSGLHQGQIGRTDQTTAAIAEWADLNVWFLSQSAVAPVSQDER